MTNKLLDVIARQLVVVVVIRVADFLELTSRFRPGRTRVSQCNVADFALPTVEYISRTGRKKNHTRENTTFRLARVCAASTNNTRCFSGHCVVCTTCVFYSEINNLNMHELRDGCGEPFEVSIVAHPYPRVIVRFRGMDDVCIRFTNAAQLHSLDCC